MKLPDLQLEFVPRDLLAIAFPDGGPDLPERLLDVPEGVFEEIFTNPVKAVVDSIVANAIGLGANAKGSQPALDYSISMLAMAAILEHAFHQRFDIRDEGPGQIRIARKAA